MMEPQPNEPYAGGTSPAINTATGPNEKVPGGRSGKPPVAIKKRKEVMSRKTLANKQVGIQTRRRSLAWDHFKRVPDDEISGPTAECIYCGVRFLCGSKDYGTSNMLGHISECPKYPYALNNDPKK